ncbi:hypothetical protein H8711_03960 [Clostridiaceae bacterium NSJ-31]|uniref:Uncharacterized protein n=1 Tax=Ligaoa zhengdingensis TaxID=2763658 RepID=A0A926DZ22_9FIRM|nr:hypothetical protein [Ligaoa zhengdingensis]MBC8546089.1 hypothetical protein [Ligaoa zhengdingensis]
MKQEYNTYTEITQKLLDGLKIGDMVRINDWKQSIPVCGVSKHYIVMAARQFGNWRCVVIQKETWAGYDRDTYAWLVGRYVCRTHGLPGTMFDLDDPSEVKKYLKNLESVSLDETAPYGATAINTLRIRKRQKKSARTAATIQGAKPNCCKSSIS